jgi:glycosyltransferase involved in cell wall biosynthesis
VVLFRANAIDSDSRAKKFSLTLARLGYEVHVLSAEEAGPGKAGAGTSRQTVEPGPRHVGPVQVHSVIMTHARRDVHKLTLGARRRRQFRFVDWTPTDEYVTQVAELKRFSRLTRRRSDAMVSPEPGSPRPALWRPRWLGLRLLHEAARWLLVGRRARWRAQWAINVGYRTAWKEWDKRKVASPLLATTRGTLPEIEDYATSFGRVLDALEPDVIHAHHPLVLGTAMRAARRRRADGFDCQVVYDARENFAGIPPAEQGNVRRHTVLVREEARYIRDAAAVITVSDPIADVLRDRYALTQRPAVILNVPVDAADKDAGAKDVDAVHRPTVREAAGVDVGTPLLVYSGAVSRARGINDLVEAMAHLPGVHLALVTVPFPHPQVPALLARATELGVADRIHPLPPVGQDELLAYLAGADVAVHPMPGGSPNHDQALPNKLFEYLHAGLPLAVADAKLMAAFVRTNSLGEVFRSGDPVDLAAAVLRALEPGRPRRSRAELAARYSWQAQEDQIALLYDRVCPVPRDLRVDPEELPARFPDLHVLPGPADIGAKHPAQARPDSLESTSAPELPREPLQHTVNRGPQ